MLAKRILIVDNDPRARQSMKVLLEAWHQFDEVREAANGVEAVKLAEEFRPNIILMDVRMPVMNGLEATRVIKKQWPSIKVVLLSMYVEYEADALAVGADTFMSKTVSPQKLMAAIVDLMPKYRSN